MLQVCSLVLRLSGIPSLVPAARIKAPSACSRLGRRRLSGSGAILVSGADSLNPWERALKNRGAPAQGKPVEVFLVVLAVMRGVSPSEPLGITGRPEGGELCPEARALELSHPFGGFGFFFLPSSPPRGVCPPPGFWVVFASSDAVVSWLKDFCSRFDYQGQARRAHIPPSPAGRI